MFDSKITDDLEFLTCKALEEHGVPHAFTSRHNGFGERANGPDDHAALAHALNLDTLATMKQLHGRDVQLITEAEPTPECDGMVTDEPGLGLVVHTADCLPMLMWAEKANAVFGRARRVARHARERRRGGGRKAHERKGGVGRGASYRDRSRNPRVLFRSRR